jgi:hypothetical protein
MANVNVNLNSQYFNDERFNSIHTQNITSELTLGLPLLASTSAPTEYTELGFLAYDEADSTVMFSDGFVWHKLEGGTVTSITAGTGLTATPTNPITSTGTISITNTAVTAGAYTLTDLTVNAQGQITAASNGVVNASLTGNGTSGTPLGLALQTSAGTYNNPILTVNGVGVVTAAVSTAGLIADWMTGTVTLTGTAATTIPQTPLDANYGNQIPGNLSGGVYTATVAGSYTVNAFAQTTSAGVGDFIQNLAIVKTSASPAATAKVIAQVFEAFLLTADGYQNNSTSVGITTTLAVGDSVWATVTAGSTASTTTYLAHVSIVYVNGV